MLNLPLVGGASLRHDGTRLLLDRGGEAMVWCRCPASMLGGVIQTLESGKPAHLWRGRQRLTLSPEGGVRGESTTSLVEGNTETGKLVAFLREASTAPLPVVPSRLCP